MELKQLWSLPNYLWKSGAANGIHSSQHTEPVSWMFSYSVAPEGIIKEKIKT